MQEYHDGSQNSEIEDLRKELAQLKRENEERIRCDLISNAAMKEALYQDHPDEEINCFLASIGRSLNVDRIYIFEDNFEEDITVNTYEWCAEDVTPEIGNLQNVPREAASWWYDQFEIGEDIHILDLEAIRETEPLTYSVLKPQGVNSLIAKRLMQGDQVIGFFGVDNPRLELMSDISSFLNTLSNFLALLIRNRNIVRSREVRYAKQLEKKNAALNIALQEAEDANAAKTVFLSNMSHDIRTPMNAIIGMTTIATDHIDDKARVKDCLRKIILSGQHLVGLINDVLDMAKIESGKLTLCMEELSLREVLDTVSEITRVQVKEKSQQYDVVIGELSSANVFCDGVRLNQILLNILGNAVKFTPVKGSIHVRLWQEASPKGDDYVRTHFSIADTGIGMTPEFMATIFEAYSREEANVHKTQGTGLGMAITKRIVDSMGGVIEVESELAKGSTFHVVLDLQRAADSEEKEAEQSAANGKPLKMDITGVRLLLAEDNDINAEIAIMILEENGAVVERAEDGKIAVELFERSEPGTYDAILMDLRMPNMDGLEATRTIRALTRSDAQTIPIIAMTADAFSEDAKKCLDAGMNEHLSKPIDIEVLKRTLVKYINAG